MSETTTNLPSATNRFTTNYKQVVFGSIWLGQMISLIGSSLTGFALRVWAFEETGSVTQFALITFFYGLPGILLSPIAGALVDRWDRRWTMLLSDTIAGLSTFTVWFLLVMNQLEVWHIYIAVAFISIGGAFQQPAYTASIPLLVSKKNLGRANGMVQIGPSLGRILAPLLAGTLIVTIGLRGVTQIDLATFLFALLVLFLVRIPRPQATEAGQAAKGSLLREAAYGWRYIKARPGLLSLLLLFTAVDFTQGMVVVLIAPMVLSFADASVLGMVFSISGVGALLGAVAMSVWGGPKRRIQGVLGFSLLRSLLLLLGGIQANAWLIALASAFYLFCSQITMASGRAIWQIKVEPDVQGRVFAVRQMVGSAFFPIGQILAGTLADRVFEPLLLVDGPLAGSIGQLIGIGPGRGIGLMLMVLGSLNLILTLGGYLYPRIRFVEDELPDAISETTSLASVEKTSVDGGNMSETTPDKSLEEESKNGTASGQPVAEPIASEATVPVSQGETAAAATPAAHPPGAAVLPEVVPVETAVSPQQITATDPLDAPVEDVPKKTTVLKRKKKSRARQIAGRVGLGVLALILILVLVATWIVRRAWPQTEGTLALAGLSQPVEVVRDEWGIPHIYAENEHDLFFAQGYVQAQDRLWQMEFNRRTANGELSEVLGARTVELDTFNRNMRFRQAAEKIWQEMDDESRQVLQAFSDGITAYIETNRNQLPVEFVILGVDPEPWSPLDSLAWGNLMSMHLSSNRRLELIRAQIVAELGEEVMYQLLPVSASDSPLILPDEANHYEGFQYLDMALLDGLDDLFGTPQVGIGSNSWVVAGSRTESGLPLLANDIHIGITQPSLWYANGLHGAGYDVVGYAMNSVPAIVTGQNERIAWGITNFAPDTQDYYIERLDDEDDPTQYEYMGEWLDLEVVEETILVKNSDPVTVKYYFTHHGPIMNDSLNHDSTEPLALRWTLYEGNRLLSALLKLDRASNWDEFREAMSEWDLPGQNVLYADVDGNIGYQATGQVPIRAEGHQGYVPVPGWTDEYEWVSMIPFEELPVLFNPPEGYITSANSKIVSDDYPYYLSDSYVPGYRAKRISELIEAQTPLTAYEMHLIQLDTYAPTAEVLIPYLQVIEPQNDLEAQALADVQSWDLYHEIDRLGPAVYEAWHLALLRDIIEDDLGETITQQYIHGRYIRHATQHVPMMLSLMENPDHPWFDDKNTPEVETRDDLVRRSFSDAVAWLSQRYGDDPSQWVWGDIHTATFPHQIFGTLRNPIIGAVFNGKTYPARGGNFAVHTNTYSWTEPFDAWIISNARHVADLSDPHNSLIMPSTGQIAHAFHPHQRDLNALWHEGGSLPMSLLRDSVDANAQDRLMLTPGE